MELECLGCGRRFHFSGRTLSYTCPCGATVFVGDNGLSIPASLGLGLARKTQLPHLDYYVGVSRHMSEQKRDFIRMLRSRGSVWPWECEECRPKRCPFRWQCERWNHRLHPDNEAVVGEICVGVRHQDCPAYREMREAVVRENEPGRR